MSITEIALILFVALILFGPEDLPVIARNIGKIVLQVRRFTGDLTKEFQNSLNQTTKNQTKNSNPGIEEKSYSGELLTYDTSSNTGTNPLKELPQDIVSFPNDKQAGE